jgi:hypothetical protein
LVILCYLVYFSTFWDILPRKIWQPCQAPSQRAGVKIGEILYSIPLFKENTVANVLIF